jgi:hypothetical protein
LFMSGPVSLSLSILVYINVYLHVHVAWKWTWTGTWSGHGHSHRREYGYSCLAQSPLFKHSNVGYQISVKKCNQISGIMSDSAIFNPICVQNTVLVFLKRLQ